MELVLDLPFEELALFEGPLALQTPCVYVVWAMVPGMHRTRKALYVGGIETGRQLAPSAEDRVRWRMEMPPAGRAYVSLLAKSATPDVEPDRRSVVNRLRGALAPVYGRDPAPAITAGPARRRARIPEEQRTPATPWTRG